jgi:hypothetical protein
MRGSDRPHRDSLTGTRDTPTTQPVQPRHNLLRPANVDCVHATSREGNTG